MTKKYVFSFFVSLVIFLIFIFSTSPYKMPLIFVIVPSVAFIVAMHSLLVLGVSFLPMQKKTGRTIVYVLTIVLSVVTILLSVGQLTFRDFGLLLAFALVGMFYLSRLLQK